MIVPYFLIIWPYFRHKKHFLIILPYFLMTLFDHEKDLLPPLRPSEDGPTVIQEGLGGTQGPAQNLTSS